jgi:hypothetical protein
MLLLNEEEVPQALPALTEMLPVLNTLPKFKEMLLVAELPVTPAGSVQLYCVAPGIAGVVNTTLFCPRQAPAGPLIEAGAAGTLPALSTTG